MIRIERPVTPAQDHVPSPSCDNAAPGNINSGKKGFADFITRVKKIRHIEIYGAVAVIACMILIYISTFGGSGASTTNSLTAAEDNFVREMEKKLVSTLSQVKDAGRVSVMVTAVGSATLEIAYNIDEKTVTQSGAGGGSNTTTTIIKTPVIINGKNGSQPLVLFEIKPKLKGVVVVATGGGNPSVRLSLLRAVQALVADATVNIEILTGR
jgi:stage III sporulation protein AG